ncbi:hypothetical protein Ccrd_020966, partial [Cynara cardunculus var. scolymus]
MMKIMGICWVQSYTLIVVFKLVSPKFCISVALMLSSINMIISLVISVELIIGVIITRFEYKVFGL